MWRGALVRNDLEELRALAQAVQSRRLADASGWTLLHEAADVGFPEQIKLVRGPNIDAADADGQTALHIAARAGHYAMVLGLVDEGANMEAVDKYGCTPIAVAAACGSVRGVQALAERGAAVAHGIRAPAENVLGHHTRPTELAAMYGHIRVLEYLVRFVDVDPKRCITSAISGGRIAVLRWLHARGVPFVSVPDLVLLAAARGSTDVLNFLFELEPPLVTHCARSLKTARMCALMAAARANHFDAVRLLIATGWNVNRRDMRGKTPLFYSATRGHVLASSELVHAGADLELPTTTNAFTPLLAAVENDHAPVVRLLLGAGANVRARALDGEGPLQKAFKPLKRDVAIALLQSHQLTAHDVSIDLGMKITPLMIAVASGDLVLVSILLGVGADPLLRNADGYSSFDLANSNEMKDLMTFSIQSS